ncbi:MAG: pantetheine-phosphate adenylyltransferase [Clostridia bacterium]|nr:pantetheine-phosphate adenylyltransferase [Clostridia bacterium]
MAKTTLALLPGSYDPITLGHMDVIRRAAALFDGVVVAVMTNDMKNYVATAKSKEYMFSMDERAAMATAACEGLTNVRVISSTARLIDLVDELGADVIIKGIRNETDYAYEQHHALYNRAHNARAETLYLPADPQFDAISSTLVRDRLGKGESVDDLVPPAVAELLRESGEGV